MRLTIAGAGRDTPAVARRRRWKTLCAGGASLPAVRGRSASPLDRMRTLRLILAFCFAPAVPALAAGMYFAFTAPAIRPPLELSRLVDPGLTKIAYAVTLIAGVPTFLVIRTRQNDRWWHYVVGGALLGCLPGLVLAIMDLRSGLDVVAVAFGAPYGALSGLAFWVLGIYRASRHAV